MTWATLYPAGHFMGRGRKIPKGWIRAMAAEYDRGASLTAVGKMFGGRSSGSIAALLLSRGYRLRPYSQAFMDTKRRPDGSFAPRKPPTPARMEKIIAGLDRVKIPAEIKWLWRHWDRSERVQFVRRLMKRFRTPMSRPTGPFSANVEPFEYGSLSAEAIARRKNANTTSQAMAVKIKLASEGVIWNDILWFWSPGSRGYFAGPWREGCGRPALHHMIWEKHNGRPVPDQMTVIAADGNKNNLEPENLTLRSRGECAQINRGWLRKKRTELADQLSQFNRAKPGTRRTA